MMDDRRAGAADWIALVCFFVILWALIILVGYALGKAIFG